MRKKHLLLLVMVVSLLFNVIFVLIDSSTGSTDTSWMFVDLGPAGVQDSYFGRAPALESPIGLIGDIPGLFSMYRGNPLQNGDWNVPKSGAGLEILQLAVLFGIIPLVLVLILGRRSYGYTKTQ